MSKFDQQVVGMRCTEKQLDGSISITGPERPARIVKGGGRDVPDVVDPLTGRSRKPTALERRRYRETGQHHPVRNSSGSVMTTATDPTP